MARCAGGRRAEAAADAGAGAWSGSSQNGVPEGRLRTCSHASFTVRAPRSRASPTTADAARSHFAFAMVVLQTLAGAAAAELAPEVVLKDWSKDGIAFFNNIRTPAALRGVGAQDAFVLQGKELPPSTLARTKRLWVFVREAYLMLMVVSSASTSDCISLDRRRLPPAGGRVDPLASSMVALLGREFEYEWVAVRCQFILGMLMLVAAQAIRVRYALWSVPNLANAAATFLLFTGAEMLAFFNNKLAGGIAPACKASGLPETKNMGDLVRRWLKLQFSLLGGSDGNLLTQKLGKPVRAVAVVLLGMALYFSLAEIGRTFVAHLDEDGDGDVSWAEVEAFGRRLLGRPVEP